MTLQFPQPPTPLRPDLRSQWLLDPSVTYLNHGSFGALPRTVFEAQTRWRLRFEAEPVEMLTRRGEKLIAEAKHPVGKWLGMADADFGFVTNATEGVNAVLHSMDFAPGDELLTTTHVYGAIRNAMRHVATRAGATYREIDLPLPVTSAEQIEQTVLDAISTRTRLLVIDHITSPSALIFPVQQIIAGCAKRGVDVLVDGAHAPGMLPLDVASLGAAYYTGNLHKWTCGPKGSAFLWVRPDRQANVHPLALSAFLGEGFAREFAWQGTRDFSAWLTIPAAIEFMADLGWDRVMAHNHAMAVWAQQMICDRWGVQPICPFDGSLLGSMCTLSLPAPLDRLDLSQSQQLQQRLYDEYRIEAPFMRLGERTFLRASCQVYNVPADYERLADAISAMGKVHRRGI